MVFPPSLSLCLEIANKFCEMFIYRRVQLIFTYNSDNAIGELLDVSQRLKTASEVNAAILTSQSHEKVSNIYCLVQDLI